MLKFFYNNVLIVIFTFLIIALFSLVNLNLDFLNPLSNMFKDFDLSDLVFSQIQEDPKEDPNVVLVNLSEPPIVDRAELAQILTTINKFQPASVGIDGFYSKLRAPEDSSQKINAGDSLLALAMKATKKLVLVSGLNGYNDKKAQYDTLKISHPFFSEGAILGFANLTTTGVGNMEEFLTSRSFIPTAKCKGKTEVAFGVKLAETINPEKAKAFLARANQSEFINFKGNIGFTESSKPTYVALDFDQILNEQFEPSVIKNKIILIGFMGKKLGTKSFDDKFYTPLNKNYVGKSTPDMYGVVIHANIVSMVLSGKYINEMNNWLNLVVVFFVALFSVSLFSYFFRNLGYWYDAVTIGIQFLISLLLFTATVFAFAWYRLKIDFTLAVIAVVISGIVVEIYYGLIYKIIQKKFVRKRPN